MQKFNIIEIASIIGKHDYLSVAISRIDEAYNPYINEYGIILHIKNYNLKHLKNIDNFVWEITIHFISKFIVDIQRDYEAVEISHNLRNGLIFIY